MVDTVIGLVENDIKKIYFLSRSGLNLLPHALTTPTLENSKWENNFPTTLLDILKKVTLKLKNKNNLHTSLDELMSVIRPSIQKIWEQFSLEDKMRFLVRCRHFWGVIRHRLPSSIHEKIQRLISVNKLIPLSGRLINIKELGDLVNVEYYDKEIRSTVTISVSRVINCTGPETNLLRTDNSLLKDCIAQGILTQDELKLGINVDLDTFRTINNCGLPNKDLYTLGINLKGQLWESTAVNELRNKPKSWLSIY